MDAQRAIQEADRPSIFGIGLPRTGTVSLVRALRLLGLDAVRELGAWYPQVMGRDNWDLDLPSVPGRRTPPHAFVGAMPFAYRQLARRFPGSVFIHTVRADGPWLHSMAWLYAQQHEMHADHLLLRIFGTRHLVPDIVLAIKHAHEMAVREFFGKRDHDGYIEMNMEMGDGWAPLCRGLGLPVPSVPFPHLHKRNED